MGIGFNAEGYSDKTPSWSYGGYHDFRKNIALTIGLRLEQMKGFQEKHPTDTGFYKRGVTDWGKVKSPLLPFLMAGDSEAHWTPEDCALIAPALRDTIMNKIVVDEWSSAYLFGSYDVEQGILLCNLMDYCASHKLKLDIC